MSKNKPTRAPAAPAAGGIDTAAASAGGAAPATPGADAPSPAEATGTVPAPAAAVAPGAPAAAVPATPVAPPAKPEKKAKEPELRDALFVTSIPASFRRCGFSFGRDGMGIALALDALTEAQIEALENEPQLRALRVQFPVDEVI